MGFTFREKILLLMGDVVCFVGGLYLAFLIRYWNSSPEASFVVYAVTWSVLFITSIISFFIAGLYEKHTLIFEHRLPNLLFKDQVVNVAVVMGTFYTLPLFGASPKTFLLLYLVTSSLLVFLWRLYGRKLFSRKHRAKALLVSSSSDGDALKHEINGNERYPFFFSAELRVSDETDVFARVTEILREENISLVVADITHPALLNLFMHISRFSADGVEIIDFNDIYEEVFDRVALDATHSREFSMFPETKFLYDFIKRSADIMLALLGLVISLPLYPFVFILIKLSDRGPVFFFQERVGKNNETIRIVKFRSMNKEGTHITGIGGFLRKTRADELPQLINVLSGALSLIGPRPELPVLVEKYKQEIPYYESRHLVKPGLSGWAQIYHENHPHHGADVVETKVKLSYDLFYLKHRSPLLDLKIVLRTMQTLLSRSGA